ncbi:hypothetical protein CYMTET_11998 [Cymbomonas tetramitiformis]|uniref:Uncharacterized protein n=1 Tax=Cymbomonas tetramitiformis TaxID=36881 RepID=A0AAE0LCI1_9CHLO|nr:hypothetical protein CYMTET_11998 [Cymbomonas tetramitiformis]
MNNSCITVNEEVKAETVKARASCTVPRDDGSSLSAGNGADEASEGTKASVSSLNVSAQEWQPGSIASQPVTSADRSETLSNQRVHSQETSPAKAHGRGNKGSKGGKGGKGGKSQSLFSCYVTHKGWCEGSGTGWIKRSFFF